MRMDRKKLREKVVKRSDHIPKYETHAEKQMALIYATAILWARHEKPAVDALDEIYNHARKGVNDD